MKHHINLSLLLVEQDRKVLLKIADSGKSIINFQIDEAPDVRIIGFKNPLLTREQLIEFSKREADDYENGELGVLQHFVFCREKDIYNHVQELRKIMRKIAKAVGSADAATAIIQELSLPK